MQQLPAVNPWPFDRPARVTLNLQGGKTLTATVEAAAGSPARPFAANQVLEKIAALSARDAPGLAPAVTALRQRLEAGSIAPATCRGWIASFFA
jgi:hypothetical protein